MTGKEMLEKLQAMTEEQLDAPVVANEDKVVDINFYPAMTITFDHGGVFEEPARIYVVQGYEQ